LSTEDNLAAARGGVRRAATTAVGAAAQVDAAGRRDSGVGFGGSADTGGAGQLADCSGTAATARCRRRTLWGAGRSLQIAGC